jgi:hypothetical protein
MAAAASRRLRGQLHALAAAARTPEPPPKTAQPVAAAGDAAAIRRHFEAHY